MEIGDKGSILLGALMAVFIVLQVFQYRKGKLSVTRLVGEILWAVGFAACTSLPAMVGLAALGRAGLPIMALGVVLWIVGFFLERKARRQPA